MKKEPTSMWRGHNGFTLIEFLIYIAIVASLLTTLSALLYQLMGAQVKNQSIADVEQEGELVTQLMTQTVRNASGINSPARGASSSSLSIVTLASSTNPTIFDLSSGTLRIKEGSSSAVSLTTSRVTASNLLFQNYSRTSTPDTVHIQFTLTRVNPEGRYEYNYSELFYGTANRRHP
ncbi:MAG: prepilin-type N-terminal cleavage/methylation domain-containing protein [Patescibacteria group bacterium]